jgi:hypothetical protein
MRAAAVVSTIQCVLVHGMHSLLENIRIFPKILGMCEFLFLITHILFYIVYS